MQIEDFDSLELQAKQAIHMGKHGVLNSSVVMSMSFAISMKRIADNLEHLKRFGFGSYRRYCSDPQNYVNHKFEVGGYHNGIAFCNCCGAFTDHILHT